MINPYVCDPITHAGWELQIALSDQPEVLLRVPAGGSKRTSPLEIVLTAQQVDSLAAPLYRKALLPLEDACQQARLPFQGSFAVGQRRISRFVLAPGRHQSRAAFSAALFAGNVFASRLVCPSEPGNRGHEAVIICEGGEHAALKYNRLAALEQHCQNGWVKIVTSGKGTGQCYMRMEV